MVECHPSKVDVAGSNPVSRSIFSEVSGFLGSLIASVLRPYQTPNKEIMNG